MTQMPYICLYNSYLDSFRTLSDAARGKLVLAMLQYASTGEIPKLTGDARILWPMVRAQMDRDSEKYRDRCEINRINGAKGGRPPKNPSVILETEGLFGKPKKAKEKEKEKENNNDNDNNNENEKEMKKRHSYSSFLDLAREDSEADAAPDYYDLTGEELNPSDTPEYLQVGSPECDKWLRGWRSGSH